MSDCLSIRMPVKCLLHLFFVYRHSCFNVPRNVTGNLDFNLKRVIEIFANKL